MRQESGSVRRAGRATPSADGTGTLFQPVRRLPADQRLMERATPVRRACPQRQDLRPIVAVSRHDRLSRPLARAEPTPRGTSRTVPRTRRAKLATGRLPPNGGQKTEPSPIPGRQRSGEGRQPHLSNPPKRIARTLHGGGIRPPAAPHLRRNEHGLGLPP